MNIRDMDRQQVEAYQNDDATMEGLPSVAVEETRAPLEGTWGP